jgi:hypothetical protein
VFVWAIPFAAVVAVLAFFIKEVPLRSGPTHASSETKDGGQEGPETAPLVAAME